MGRCNAMPTPMIANRIVPSECAAHTVDKNAGNIEYYSVFQQVTGNQVQEVRFL